jgi:hypothetical protein
MWEYIKRAMCNVNQMGEFWCFFYPDFLGRNFLNWGRLERVLLYCVLPLSVLISCFVIFCDGRTCFFNIQLIHTRYITFVLPESGQII